MTRIFSCGYSDNCSSVDHWQAEAERQTALAEKYKLLQSMCMICVERKCAECKDYNRIQKEADK